MKVDGKVYGIPTDLGGMGIFYNRALFEEYDVEIPTTHEALMEVATMFEAEGIIPFAHGFKEGWPAQCDIQSDLYGYCLQQNPLMFTEIQAGEKAFADYPEFEECIQRAAERLSFESGDDFGTDSLKARSMLLNKEAAMLISGNWEISEFVETGVDDQIGFFATPNTDDEEPVLGLASGNSFLISAQTQHVEEALKFVEFLSTKRGSEIMNSQGTAISCVKGVDSDNISSLTMDIIEISQNGKVYNYEAEDIFTGQYDSVFRKWQEEFAADPDRNVAEYISKLDAEIAAIQP